MPPINLTTPSSRYVPDNHVTFLCPLLIETLIDPILRFQRTGLALCSGDRMIYGSKSFLLIGLECAVWVTAMSILWRLFGYFAWWRAVWREINRTREELGLMAQEEW